MTTAFIMAVFWISNVTTIVTSGAAGLSYFVFCCVAFFYSWIPTLIGNNTWWYLVGGLTGICLALSAMGSMVASGEASWERVKE